MKLPVLFSTTWLLASITAHPLTTTCPGFAGVNSYFLHAFQEPNRTEVLDAVQAAGLKAVRLFISYTEADNKGTGSVEMPDIEPVQVGVFDDTQLLAIDQLMIEAHARDIRLTIAIHDRYQLGCWGNDSYVREFDLPAVNCNYEPASKNNVTSWYTDPAPIAAYDNRIKYVLEHSNNLIPGSPQWKDLDQYIFSLEIENEAEGHLNDNIAPVPEWWCDRAKFMRSLMGDSKVLISTGGGNDFSNSDIPDNWACSALDVVDIHSYSNVSTFEVEVPICLQHALAADKRVMFEEFGALGVNKSQEIADYITVFNNLKVPWMPWEISKPGMGASNYEFWTDEPTYGVVKAGSSEAASQNSAQSLWCQ